MPLKAHPLTPAGRLNTMVGLRDVAPFVVEMCGQQEMSTCIPIGHAKEEVCLSIHVWPSNNASRAIPLDLEPVFVRGGSEYIRIRRSAAAPLESWSGPFGGVLVTMHRRLMCASTVAGDAMPTSPACDDGNVASLPGGGPRAIHTNDKRDALLTRIRTNAAERDALSARIAADTVALELMVAEER